MASFEYVLAVEHWLQVMEMVPLKDLCNVVLTSKHMNSLASSQELWAKANINKEMAMRNGLTQLYRINRFKKIKEIDFSSMGDCVTANMLENLFNDIQISPLQKVDFLSTNLSGAPAEPLAKAVSHLRNVSLERTRLTTFQSTKVLETSLSSRSLEEVNLAHVNLSGVPADLLARAICRLKTANLRYTRLTAQQTVTLMETSLTSMTLEDVNLYWVDLSGVPADLLARAVCRLRTVNLAHTRLTAQQSASLMETSLTSNTLEDVNLYWVDLSLVPADLLARAVCRLRTVNLADTNLTDQQTVTLVEASLSSIALEYVNLTRIDLSGVPTDLLARAVCRLRTVNLAHTLLVAQQSASIVEAILSSNTLVSVDLTRANISRVPSDLLARAVGRLQSVNLSDTEMSRDQWIAVDQAVLSSTSLRQVDLRLVRLERLGTKASVSVLDSAKEIWFDPHFY